MGSVTSRHTVSVTGWTDSRYVKLLMHSSDQSAKPTPELGAWMYASAHKHWVRTSRVCSTRTLGEAIKWMQCSCP